MGRVRLDEPDPARITRLKPDLPVTWVCACGRTFTARGGRSNHARRCVWAQQVDAEQLAAFAAVIDRARARAAGGAAAPIT